MTLMAGVITKTVFAPENVLPKTATEAGKNNFPDNKQLSLNAADVFVSVGMANQQIRLTNTFQLAAFRLFSSTSNTHRILYSEQITQQQYLSGYTVFLLKSAFEQLDGYYLYHLRKLLI